MKRGDPEATVRERILDATFEVLCERGYIGLSTRDIAARAQVSKREIYAEFGNKQGMFGALVEKRAARMRQPLDAASTASPRAFAETLERFGTAFVTELSDPAVLAMFRLAIASADDAPEAAHALEQHARAPLRKALVELMQRARSAGRVTGEPAELAARLSALLVGDIHVSLLLGLGARPTARDIERRVAAAVEAFLRLHGRGRATRRHP